MPTSSQSLPNATVLAPARTMMPAPAPEATAERGHASRLELVAVLVLSIALAMAMWHIAWEHPFTTQLGTPGDSDEYSWFLAWIPYSIGHGLDPLISHYVNFPNGVNLMWNTSVILPGFIMSPVTVIFNAAFSYNILITAAPRSARHLPTWRSAAGLPRCPRSPGASSTDFPLTWSRNRSAILPRPS